MRRTDFAFSEPGRGHRDLVTVVGQAAAISAGEWITVSGEWVNDRTHGQQFRSRFPKTSAPTSVEGIEKFADLPFTFVPVPP
jgi:exodeoxyribonuclease V alpha subunit